MDLLTHSVNVPAEREKLRRLRDEIAAEVAARKEHDRKYTARGFVRLDYMPDVQALDAKGQRTDGETPIRQVCAGSALGLPASAADMPEAQTSGDRCGCESGCVEQQGVRA